MKLYNINGWRALRIAVEVIVMVLILVSIVNAADSNNIIFSDDFNDNTLNTSQWIGFIKGYGLSMAETNQRLEIAFPADSTDDPTLGIFEARYNSICQLRGDFDMQVDYNLLVWPFANGVRVGLGAIRINEEVPPLNYGTVERASWGSANDMPGFPREVYLTHFDDGVQGISTTADQSGKLRLVRSGNTITGYYFSSGYWVALHSGHVTTEDVPFSISAWSHDYSFTDQEVKVAFDNFIVNQGQLVCPIIHANTDIKPDTLNKASHSDENAVAAYIEIPGYDVNNIDVGTITLSTAKGSTSARLSPTEVGDYNSNGVPDLMVKFDRQEVIAIVETGERVKIKISGKVAGAVFEGANEIRVIEQRKK